MTAWGRLARYALAVAVATLALSVGAHVPAAFAQGVTPAPSPTTNPTDSPSPAPAKDPHVVHRRTTTSADGLTTTQWIATPKGLFGYVYTTIVTTKNKDGFAVSEKTTTQDDTSGDDYTETVSTKTYNDVGGYSEVIDEKHTGKSLIDNSQTTWHEELQCDADGNVQSGTRVIIYSDYVGGSTTRVPIRTRKFTWDAGAKTWVSSEKTALQPFGPDAKTTANATGQVIAPPVTSPGKQVMLTPDALAINERYRGTFAPTGLAVLFAYMGSKSAAPISFAPASTSGSVYVDVPADATSLSVVKEFDSNGNPVTYASKTVVSLDAPVPGLNVPNTSLPLTQPGIVAWAGAYDVRSGMITLQTQNTSVADTLVLDTEHPLTTLAASDRSIVASLPPNIALGRHEIGILNYPGLEAFAVPFDAISLTVDPMPAVENVGDTATPTVHVVGMIPGDVAVMEFAIGGSAELTGGGTFTSVPVIDNVASCTIIGVRSGEALVRFHLRMIKLAPTPQS